MSEFISYRACCLAQKKAAATRYSYLVALFLLTIAVSGQKTIFAIFGYELPRHESRIGPHVDS
jgi:hypothetical protein